MTLFKTSLFSGLATFVRTITGFIVAKVFAIYVGPAGFALFGQFQNFAQLILMFSGNMIQSGVVKYTAEYQDDPENQRKIFSTSILICLFSSAIIGTILFSFSRLLSRYIFHTIQYQDIFHIFSISIFLFVLNAFLVAILNGQKEIKKFTAVNISGSIISLLLSCFFIRFFGLEGALLAVTLNQSLVFFISLAISIRSRWFKLQDFFHGIDKKMLSNLLRYAVMGVIAAISLPVTQFLVRDYIGQAISWQAAGYWQAMVRVSDGYLLLITTTLAIYYLPKLSQLKTIVGMKKEIKHGYQLILPAAAFLGMVIFVLKRQIVSILFSNDFMPMVELFKFQLCGDVLKIGAWLLAYVMLAKALTRIFILTEIIFSISFYLLAVFFIHLYGLQGVTIAFMCNYALYWLTMLVLIKRVNYGIVAQL